MLLLVLKKFVLLVAALLHGPAAAPLDFEGVAVDRELILFLLVPVVGLPGLFFPFAAA